jgi:hypothetical protein
MQTYRIDSHGGELRVAMTPATDLSCSQNFIVSWEFEPEVSAAHECDTISVPLSNVPDAASSGHLDCYVESKARIQHGGSIATAFRLRVARTS